MENSNSMSRDDCSRTLDYILRLSMSSSDGRVCKKKKKVYQVRRLRWHGTFEQTGDFLGAVRGCSWTGQAMEAKLRQGYSASAAGLDQHQMGLSSINLHGLLGWSLRVGISSCMM